eukprot:1195661-Prorocentrum_minimum.AAC.1
MTLSQHDGGAGPDGGRLHLCKGDHRGALRVTDPGAMRAICARSPGGCVLKPYTYRTVPVTAF